MYYRYTTARCPSIKAQFTFSIKGDDLFEILLISVIMSFMMIDEFQKMDLRVGKILTADRVEGSEKLLKLSVDIGEPRQILSGIAKSYAPEDLVGREVVVIANLEPRMMMGMESQGMILAAHGEAGDPVLLAAFKKCRRGRK